jgi:hypothetical protein
MIATPNDAKLELYRRRLTSLERPPRGSMISRRATTGDALALSAEQRATLVAALNERPVPMCTASDGKQPQTDT